MLTNLICPICHDHNVIIRHRIQRDEAGTLQGYYAACESLEHPDITGVFPTARQAVAGAEENGAYNGVDQDEALEEAPCSSTSPSASPSASC